MEQQHDDDPLMEEGGGDESTANMVCLPGPDYVLLKWKTKHGASVQKGETIAYAIKGLDVPIGNGATNPSTTTTTKHKRPKKRKRVVPSANKKATEISNTAAPTNNTAASVVSTFTSSGKESIAKKENKADTTTTTTSSSKAMVSIVAPSDGLLQINTTTSHPADNDGKSITIGWIKKCTHPAIMGGLCAICGKSVATITTNPQENNNLESKEQQLVKKQPLQHQVTVSGGVTMVVSQEEAQLMSRQSRDKLLQQRKLNLVLDLDHTLVHATADVRAKSLFGHDRHVRTLLLPLMEGAPLSSRQHEQQNFLVQHYIKLRPHVKEFFQQVMPLYEVSIYTAGTRSYAQQVSMVLCRHLVGATRDVQELKALEHEVFVATSQLKKVRQLQKQESNGKETNDTSQNGKQQADTAPLTNKKDKEKESTQKGEKQERQEDTTETQSTNQETKEKESTTSSNDDKPMKTNIDSKKKVSFGASPVALKTDAISPQQVDELKQQLQQAQELEAKAVELRQLLFGSRIVSRTDVGDLGRDVKSLKRIFPCGGTMAAIVDDREDVWARDTSKNFVSSNHATLQNGPRKGEPPENLLLVRPYHWKPFVGFAEVNNPSGKLDFNGGSEDNDKKSANNKDHGVNDAQEEKDEQLLWTCDVLKRLHKRFYDKVDSKALHGTHTVPNILREMRGQVLDGKRLVLSGLIPLHKQQQQKSPFSPRPNVVRYAESLGAKIFDTVQSDTTHVVAARDGTDKILKGRQVPGCVVVKASWLTECMYSLTLRDVKPHILGNAATIARGSRGAAAPVVSQKPAASTTTTGAVQFSSCSDGGSSGEDDELEAELENEMLGL